MKVPTQNEQVIVGEFLAKQLTKCNKKTKTARNPWFAMEENDVIHLNSITNQCGVEVWWCI